MRRHLIPLPALVSAALLTFAACSGAHPAAPPSTAAAATPSAARPEGSTTPLLHYEYRSKSRCEGPVIFCKKGYPFYNKQGCGCAENAVFPVNFDPLACQSAADCVISYLHVNTCCGDLCTASQPYNRSAEKRLQRWHKNNCERAVCPVASCVESPVSFKATCNAGRCQAVQVRSPLHRPRGSSEEPQPLRISRTSPVFACHAEPSGKYYTCWERTGRRLGTTFQNLAKDFPRSTPAQRKQWLANYKTGCLKKVSTLPPSGITRFALHPSALKKHQFCVNVSGDRYWWRAHGADYVFTTEAHRGNFSGERWHLRVTPASAARLRNKTYPALKCPTPDGREGTATGDKNRAWSFGIRMEAGVFHLEESSVASPRMTTGGVETQAQFARFIKKLRCGRRQRKN